MSASLDPNTPAIGRQPKHPRIAPSKSYPWYGAWQVGHRFTVAQEQELARREINPADAPWILVKRQANRDEEWWPSGTLPPVYASDCPVIEQRDDQVRVISPGGFLKTVAADGWAHRPCRRPRDVWGYSA